MKFKKIDVLPHLPLLDGAVAEFPALDRETRNDESLHVELFLK
jgi:hypothetical protein